MLYKVTEELDCGAWALDRDLATTFTSGCEKKSNNKISFPATVTLYNFSNKQFSVFCCPVSLSIG